MNDLTFDPIYRPGLAYQHAFDWLALGLSVASGPVACLAQSTFEGAELLRRLGGVAFLAPSRQAWTLRRLSSGSR